MCWSLTGPRRRLCLRPQQRHWRRSGCHGLRAHRGQEKYAEYADHAREVEAAALALKVESAEDVTLSLLGHGRVLLAEAWYD